MPSSLISVFLVALVFLLFTQLSVLTVLRLIRSDLQDLLKDVQDRKDRQAISSFEKFSSQEARSTFRTKVEVDVILTYLGQEIKGKAEDLSATGMLLSFSEDLEFSKGDVFPILLKFTEDDVEAKFRIIREVSPREYGGCFEAISVKGKRVVKNHIKKQALEQLSKEIS